MFGSIVIGLRMPVLCDAGHFYEPLFEWNAEQAQTGDLPVWNANANLGTPVAADATSSAFYPGKFVFRCHFLPFETLNGIYTSLHILMAAIGIFVFARNLKCHRVASTLTAISFAFGGSILFQTSNVVFLVGAAWLPWAALAVWNIHRNRQWHWSLLLSLSLSMMVLGGDPQMAYHVGLIGGLLWIQTSLSKFVSNWRVEKIRAAKNIDLKPVAVLGASALLAVGISAIQIFPTHQWSQTSKRKSFETPRNVYEIPEYLSREDSNGWAGVQEGLIGKLESGTHQNRLYHFSQPPWTLVELVSPSVTGTMTPYHSRWATLAPSLGRVWQSSLYLGLIPLVFAACSFTLRNRDRRKTWLSCLIAFSILASFGWYGLGWALKIAGTSTYGVAPSIENQVGGIYWTLVTFFPGYSDFRYPAKWFIIANFAISLLAGVGFAEITRQVNHRKLWIICLTILGISLVALAYVGWNQESITESLIGRNSDSYFGPFDAQHSLANIKTSLLHTSMVAAAGLILFFLIRLDRKRVRRKSIWIVGLVLLTGLEVYLANDVVVPSISTQNAYESVPNSLNSLIRSSNKSQHDSSRIYRFASDGHPDWSRTRSDNRVKEIYQWENDVLDCKNGLKLDVPVLGISNSIPQQDLDIFLEVSAELAKSQGGAVPIHQTLLNALSIRWLWMPKGTDLGESSNLKIATHSFPDNIPMQLVENQSAGPRSWIVHNFEVLPQLTNRSNKACRQRTREAFLNSADELRDFSITALVESDSLKPQSSSKGNRKSNSNILYRDHRSIRIQASLECPGLLVVNDYFEKNWKCQIRKLSSDGKPSSNWIPKEILRTNRVLRGVSLPEGEFEVAMFYEPKQLAMGSWITMATCILFIMVALFHVFWCRKRLQLV